MSEFSLFISIPFLLRLLLVLFSYFPSQAFNAASVTLENFAISRIFSLSSPTKLTKTLIVIATCSGGRFCTKSIPCSCSCNGGMTKGCVGTAGIVTTMWFFSSSLIGEVGADVDA